MCRENTGAEWGKGALLLKSVKLYTPREIEHCEIGLLVGKVNDYHALGKTQLNVV